MAIPTIGTTPRRAAQQDDVSGDLIKARDIVVREDFNALPAKASVAMAYSPKSSGRIPNYNFLLSGKNLSGQFNSSRGAQHDISGRGCLVIGCSSKSSNRAFVYPRGTGSGQAGGKSKWQRLIWPTSASPFFETTIRLFAANTFANAIIQAGLLLTHVFDKTTDDDQIKFWFAAGTSATKLYVTVSIAGTGTTTDTGIVLAANTNYKLQIDVDGSRIARCYVNGDRVPCFQDALSQPIFQTTALTSANLVPHVGIRVQTNSAVRPKLGIYSVTMGKIAG